MKSYGTFRNFEIRDVVNINPEITYENRFDVVSWTSNHTSCFSIARLTYNKSEGDFEFESIRLRYLTEATPDLNEWLVKWCELKKYEFEHIEDND